MIGRANLEIDRRAGPSSGMEVTPLLDLQPPPRMSLYNYVDAPNSNLVRTPVSYLRIMADPAVGMLYLPVRPAASVIRRPLTLLRMPFTDPTTTQTCAHTFCRDCILRAIDHAPQCPVDRSPLTAGGLAPANPIVRSVSCLCV